MDFLCLFLKHLFYEETSGGVTKLMLAGFSGQFYPGDLVTHTGKLEIRTVSGRLPGNPGELGEW